MKRFYHPLTLYDLERLAEERLATDYWHIVAGGVGDEITCAATGRPSTRSPSALAC